ncbi:MAG TPA: DUF748 domain-containing protein [Burkholderiales bacterium]|nr:DUF748 domain-containing protein [Burkholderiales bacterium]
MKRTLLIAGGAVLAAVVLFAAIGFLAVPPLLRSQLEKLSQEKLQRTLTIGEIKVNPFDLKLEMRDVALKDKDGSPLASFERLLVDYEIFPALTQRAFGFREISLARPLANVVVDREGMLNFARLIADATRDTPPKQESNEPLPRVIVDKLEIDRAGINFRDERRAEPFTSEVDPVAVLLTDLNTLPDREGKQSLVARTPEGEQLKWEGEFTLSPLQSRGTIALTGLSGPKLWRFGKDLVNFEIPSGTADVSAAYEVDLKQPQPRVHATDIRAHLKGWAMKSHNKEDRVLRLDSLEVGPGTFDLGGRTLVLDQIVASGGGMGAQRGSDNLINWVELLKLKGAEAARETAAVAADQKPAGEESPWRIELKAFRVEKFGFTFSDDAAVQPYDASINDIGLAFAAAVDYAGTGSQITVEQIVLGLKDLSLKPRNEQAPILTLAGVELGTGAANYKDKSVQFDALKISKPRGEAWIDGDGKLNWMGLAPREAAPAVAPERAEESRRAAEQQPWHIGLKTIEVVDGGVTFTDRGMTPPVAVKVEPIRVRLDGASSDLKQPVSYDMEIGLPPGGQFTAKGTAVPATPQAEGTLALRDLPLKLGERYVNRFALLVLKSGTVSAGGKYAFAMRDGKPTAQYKGGFQVAKLDLIEEDTKERFLGWDLVDARDIDFKFEPTRLDILEVRLDRPAGKFIIYEDRTLNIQRILRTTGDKGGKPEAAAQGKAAKPGGTGTATGAGGEADRQVGREAATSSVRFGAAPAAKPQAKRAAAPTQAAALPFPVNIQRVRVNQGQLFFADLTLTPQFGTRIHDLNGTLNNLSTRPGSKAQMKLDGVVDEYGLARFAGDLSPFAPSDYLNVTATFRNVELTSMTPYSAKFAGYRIASGKLDADLAYLVQQRELKGDNKIVVDQLTLGEKVESPDALDLPLELGIALLKDADGKIDLGLPVSGSLDDPQFSIAGIVWKALTNVMKKIITAPFRALGALLGVSSEELEGVSFDPGSDELLPPEKAKLERVAAALDKRPQLKIGIRPVYATQDAEAIRSLRVRTELAKRIGLKLKKGEDPGPMDVTDPKNQDAIRGLFAERFGSDALAKIRDDAEKAQSADGKPLTPEAKEQMRAQIAETLLGKLEAGEQVSDEELKALAQRRADGVKAEFAAQGKLPAERISVEPVEKVDAAGKKMIESKFTLVS